MWRIILSDPLPITALVSHYPTNKLIGRSPLSRRHNRFPCHSFRLPVYQATICGITSGFPEFSPTDR